jgi:hypothetical protein
MQIKVKRYFPKVFFVQARPNPFSSVYWTSRSVILYSHYNLQKILTHPFETLHHPKGLQTR